MNNAGELLLQLCLTCGLVITNGRFGKASEGATCITSLGQAVDDYILVDIRCFDKVIDMQVYKEEIGEDSGLCSSNTNIDFNICEYKALWASVSDHRPI